MNKKWLGPCGLAMAVISGCAMPDMQAGVPREEPVYVTGSNIARRQAVAPAGDVTTMSGQDFERLRIPQMPMPAPGGGH